MRRATRPPFVGVERKGGDDGPGVDALKRFEAQKHSFKGSLVILSSINTEVDLPFKKNQGAAMGDGTGEMLLIRLNRGCKIGRGRESRTGDIGFLPQTEDRKWVLGLRQPGCND
jgi:hypothetical protein